jgi:hypothetical protein
LGIADSSVADAHALVAEDLQRRLILRRWRGSERRVRFQDGKTQVADARPIIFHGAFGTDGFFDDGR